VNLLLLFHSIKENSGMENFVLDLKRFSKYKITIIYRKSISSNVKSEFDCFQIDETNEVFIKKFDCLVFFKEYRKRFNLTKKHFSKIKKICAIYEPISFSDYFDSYDFQICEGVITNFLTNIIKLNSLTDLPKFHAYTGLDFSQLPKIKKNTQFTVGVISKDISKLEKTVANASCDFIRHQNKDQINFYNQSDVVIIEDQDDMQFHIWKCLYYNKILIIKKNHFTQEIIDDCKNGFFYKTRKDIHDLLIKVKDKNNLRMIEFQNESCKIANIELSINKLQENIKLILGFDKTNAKTTYYDSGIDLSYESNDVWQTNDTALCSALDESGMRFFSCVDKEIIKNVESEFIGILHNDIKDYKKLDPCKGLFVFSEYLKKSIEKNTTNVPVEKIYYPVKQYQKKFSYTNFIADKKIVFLQKKYQPFVQKSFSKLIIKLTQTNIVKYEKTITSSLVYFNFDEFIQLDFFLECLERNTPMLLKRHPIAEEYLGKNYPLFFTTKEDIVEISCEQVLAAHNYLVNIDKEKFRIQTFIKSIVDSKIYKELPVTKPKTLIRITLGKTSVSGYEITFYCIKSLIKNYGYNDFDYCICHNNISERKLFELKNKFSTIDSPLKYYKQKNCELPIDVRFPKGTDATISHCISAGSLWKLCPARLRPNAHEIIIDNDIIFLKQIPEINQFLKSNLPLTLEDPSIHMGAYELINDFDDGFTLNSGIIGLPPNFKFEKKLCSLWNACRPLKNVNGGDEQGLITSVLKKGEHILITRNNVIGMHPNKLHVNSFNSGTTTYQILKDNTESDFIDYERIDFNKLCKKTCALHFFQINRHSITHNAWDKFMNHYKYLISPKSII
jgi:hypothetical protein